MMVRLYGGVEGSAKIAMTPLLCGRAAMGLLPNDVPSGLIFPDADVARILIILNRAADPAWRIFANGARGL